MLAVGIALVAVLQGMAGNGSWRQPFFYDEMWRVDFIRSSRPIDRMLTHDTPIPIGWVELMRLLTAPLPYRPVVFRAAAIGWMLFGVGVLAVLFARIIERAPAGRSWVERASSREWPAWMSAPVPMLAAPVGVGLAFFTPAVTGFTQWFNNYTFEIAYLAVLVLAAEELDRSRRWPFPTLCTLVALAPLMVLGALFAVPALVLGAAWWIFHDTDGRDRRRPRLLALVGASAVAGGFGVLEWVKVYKPVSAKPSISSFWIDKGASLGGPDSIFTLLAHTADQLTSGLVGPAISGGNGTVRAVGTVVLLASIVTGAVVVGRRWPLVLFMVGSAWALTIVASAVFRWPMTIERVNVCWQIFFFAMAGVGLARAVLWFTPKHASLAIPAFVLLFAAMWFPPYDPAPETFARNLTYDLERVANSPAQRNVVFQYHYYGHFYADNELINTPRGDKRFDIVPQLDDDRSLFSPLDGVLRDQQVKSGDLVWCLMPWELGVDTQLACRFDDPTKLEPVIDERGRGSVIKAYRVR